MDINWVTRKPSSQDVDKKSHVMVTINTSLRDENKKSLNITIPASIITDTGLVVGQAYAVAISEKKIMIKQDDLGFVMGKVGNRSYHFGGKIHVPVGQSLVKHILDEERGFKKYVSTKDVHVSSDKIVTINLA